MTIDVQRASQFWIVDPQSLATRRLAVVTGVLLAAGIGAVAGHMTAPVITQDADLALLLRFMALMKAAIVIAATGLVLWRLGSDLPPRLAVGYGAALGLMALSPGLIWSQSSLTLASALFHSGLLLGLVLAARDGLKQPQRLPQASSASTHLRMP